MTNTVCLSPNGVDIHSLPGEPDCLFVATMASVFELRRVADAAWHVVRQQLPDVHVSSLVA